MHFEESTRRTVYGRRNRRTYTVSAVSRKSDDNWQDLFGDVRLLVCLAQGIDISVLAPRRDPNERKAPNPAAGVGPTTGTGQVSGATLTTPVVGSGRAGNSRSDGYHLVRLIHTDRWSLR